jgi:hypothetical protein
MLILVGPRLRVLILQRPPALIQHRAISEVAYPVPPLVVNPVVRLNEMAQILTQFLPNDEESDCEMVLLFLTGGGTAYEMVCILALLWSGTACQMV